MRDKTNRKLRNWLRDVGIGALVFALLPMLALGIGAPSGSWTMDEAFAAEVIATRAVEVTAPPGPAADNAIVAAAQLRPSGTPMHIKRLADMTLLGLTFSLLVSFNLAFWRHLKRVSSAQRVRAGRRKA